MERKVKSFRLRTDLLEWVKSYAATRGSTEVAVLELALSSLKRDAEGGVPDLPRLGVVAKPKPAPVQRGEPQTYAAVMAARQARLNKEMGWDK